MRSARIFVKPRTSGLLFVEDGGGLSSSTEEIPRRMAWPLAWKTRLAKAAKTSATLVIRASGSWLGCRACLFTPRSTLVPAAAPLAPAEQPHWLCGGRRLTATSTPSTGLPTTSSQSPPFQLTEHTTSMNEFALDVNMDTSMRRCRTGRGGIPAIAKSRSQRHTAKSP